MSNISDGPSQTTIKDCPPRSLSLDICAQTKQLAPPRPADGSTPASDTSESREAPRQHLLRTTRRPPCILFPTAKPRPPQTYAYPRSQRGPVASPGDPRWRSVAHRIADRTKAPYRSTAKCRALESAVETMTSPTYCECVKRFFAEDRSQYLVSMREYARMMSPDEQTLRRYRALAALAGFVANAIPVIHLWRTCRHGFTKRLLEKMHMSCWAVGLGKGCDVQDPHDFQHVLLRWARENQHRHVRDRDDSWTDLVAESVSTTFRTAHVRVLTFGFLPVVGPVFGSAIERSLVASFQRHARRFYDALASTGEQHLHADSVRAHSQSAAIGEDTGFLDSPRRCVESYWAGHLSDEHMRVVRAATPIAGSVQGARLLSAAAGLIGSWLPGFHIRDDPHQINMFLKSLQAICLGAGVRHGCEGNHATDLDRVAWRWATTRSEKRSRSGASKYDQSGREALIAAVSAKIKRASMWKHAFGVLPILGPVAGFLIYGSMGARFYRVSRAYFRARLREDLNRTGRGAEAL